jgi:hypothetical protein
MTIHSQEERPEKAYVAVQYRGWWFYVADDDPSSKATFTLLNILFSLQSETGKGKTPLLTLPIGNNGGGHRSQSAAPTTSPRTAAGLAPNGRTQNRRIASPHANEAA